MSDDLDESVGFLYETLLKLRTKEDCEKFFADLCTYKEIDSMAQRLTAAKMLLAGDTYGEIIKKTDIWSNCIKNNLSPKKRYDILQRENK